MPKLLRYFLSLSIPLIILDQVTKWWVVLHFRQPYVFVDGEKYRAPADQIDSIPVIDDFFTLVRVHNQGVAFGLGNHSSWAPIVFLCVPFIATALILSLWKKGVFTGFTKWCAPLLLAGIIGNFIDRIFQGFWLKGIEQTGFWNRLSEGYVVDFLDFKFPFEIPFTGSEHWPAFNVADSCITIAATLLFISAFLPEKKTHSAS